MAELIAKIKKFKGTILMEVGTRDCYIWLKVNKGDLEPARPLPPGGWWHRDRRRVLQQPLSGFQDPIRRHDMDITTLLAKIHTAAKTARVDAEANMLARLADRVAHQGAAFEAPLTESELALVKRFMKL
jgi:hypothetical protein